MRSTIIKNGLAAAVQKITRSVDQLLLVPFFLGSWGPAVYGEWLLIMGIPAALALTDFGVGTAAANRIVLSYSAGDSDAAGRFYRVAKFLLFGLAGILSVAIAVVALYISENVQPVLRHLPWSDGIFAASLVTISRVFGFVQAVDEAKFKVSRTVNVSMNWQSGYVLANVGFSMIVLTAGGGVLALAVVMSVLSLAFTGIYGFMAGRYFKFSVPPNLQFVQTCQALFYSGSGYLLGPAWQIAFFQGLNVIINATLGAASVAVFNTARTLARILTQAYSVAVYAVINEMQLSLGRGDPENAGRLYRRTQRLILAIAVIGCMLQLWLGPQFFKVWTRGNLQLEFYLWVALVVGALLNSLWWLPSFVVSAANMPFKLALVGCIGAGFSLLFSPFGAVYAGLIGVAVSCLVLDLVQVVGLLPLVSRTLRLRRVAVLFG